MNIKEIKEAIEWAKKFKNNFKDGVNEVKELKYADMNLQTLITTAEQVRDAEVPKEINPYASGMGSVVDYNKGIRACKPYIVKKDMEIEELKKLFAHYGGMEAIKETKQLQSELKACKESSSAKQRVRLCKEIDALEQENKILREALNKISRLELANPEDFNKEDMLKELLHAIKANARLALSYQDKKVKR